ncbi:MAG TPA: serine hydrolase [Caulobacteraceae bacterium]|jgi:CubicO group peptidase (beta-lactamase class C family)
MTLLLSVVVLAAGTPGALGINALAAVPAADRAAASVEARIGRIERGLLHGSVIADRPRELMPLRERMSFHRVPGVSIAVLNGYHVEWARSWGTLGAGSSEALTVNTPFQGASISKPLVAVAVMRLVERGELSLDSDVNRWLKTWKVPENEFTTTRKVTVRDLLSHTAGLRIMAFDGVPVGQAFPSTVDLLEGRVGPDGPIRVVRQPGSSREYTGAGFLVLQQLLEDVTGKPFPRLMEELVLAPAGMKNTTFDQAPSAAETSRRAKGAERGEAVPGGWLLKPNMASGGVWTTATDLARFLSELQKAYVGKPSKLLRPASARAMIDSVPIQAPQDGRPISIVRGLGLEVQGEGVSLTFGHGGNNTGYRSEMIGLPDGRGVVVLVNGGAQGLIREITRAVATEYQWPTPHLLPAVRTVVTVPETTLRTYVGRYEWPEGRRPPVSDVTLEDGVLRLEGVPLLPEAKDRFFTEGGPAYRFTTDPAGRVSGFVFEVPGLTLTAVKVGDATPSGASNHWRGGA